jgi:hypothetical protein
MGPLAPRAPSQQQKSSESPQQNRTTKRMKMMKWTFAQSFYWDFRAFDAMISILKMAY